VDPIERVQAVLAGQHPDRPPVSFWCHFAQDRVCGPAAVEAHIAHQQSFDLDFLKVMNDNPYPSAKPIERPADLHALPVLRGDEPEFARQLDLLAALKSRLGGRVWINTTVFNAWTTLRHLVRPPQRHQPPRLSGEDEPTATLRQYFEQDPDGMRHALGRIGASLSNFARRCIEAGADGVFLSVRDDWLDGVQDHSPLYRQLVEPTDREILAAAERGRLNVLHVCGRAVDFPAFAAYPCHVLNWADRAAGPSVADVVGWLKPAPAAGVDNLSTLPMGSPEDVRGEVNDALRQAGDRPLIIAPGCTYDPDSVPAANLHAMVEAARGWAYGRQSE
jgi:uroporphyrinogen decarboxylase